MVTSYPSLPTLNHEQLAVSFDGDPEAIRRYKILEAVLRHGVSQREAAEHAGVSERTVRNVLQMFRSGGLDRLRSRVATPRRTVQRRVEDHDQVLAAALDEAPDAGGDRLWRRACELLGDDGADLSRRTAYRILGRLRLEREREAEPNEDLSLLRPALALLLEDPPLSLGSTTLAIQMLPDEDNTLLRGTILKQVLHSLIDRLRPLGEVSTIDRDWWPYLICSGEYEAGQSRAELEDVLALSASTYSRAKRQGLNQIAAALPHAFEARAIAPRAQTSQRLPRAADFVGRHEEQAYYAWRLQTEGRAYIWGLPGSGKTALAAELAAAGRRYGQLVVCHTCDTSTNARLSNIVRGLLRELLPREQRLAPEHTADELLDILREQLQRRPTVVVIDDLHRADSQEIAPLIALLDAMIERKLVRMLLVSRQPPEQAIWPMLPGMAENEARLLWTDLAIPEMHWQALYAASGGFPQPLRILAASYRRAGELAWQQDPAQEAKNWVREQIWSHLSTSEQALLALACGLAEQPWASQSKLVLEALAIDDEILGLMFRRGLFTSDDRRLRILPVLRAVATEALAENAELQTLQQAVIVALDAEQTCSLDIVQPLDILMPIPLAAVPDEHDETLGLLDRLRIALDRSVTYLQKGSDQTAHGLADELAALVAALPDPALMRR